MTDADDRDRPVEHDPTGMRALLASLPDPGPMPDDLVARISAALRAEVRSGGSFVDDGPDAVGSVVPLRRRSRVRYLGLAAVAAVAAGVLGLGAYALDGLTGGGATASLDAVGGSSDSGAGAGADSKAEAQDRPAAAAPEAGSGEVVVVMSGVDHASKQLAVTARALDEGGLDPLRELAAESPALGPIATPVGARACADALGIPAGAGILVDVSEVDGAPAAVLVVHDGAGRSAWAVERSCPSGTTGPISGPVPLD